MGGVSGKEVTLGILVGFALLLWMFGGSYIKATTVALVVISLMLIVGVFTWKDMMANSAAWNTLAWFATMVALADGLNRVGFVKWFADAIASRMRGLSPTPAVIGLVVIFFLAHYLFASLTAHATAMLPVTLAAGATIPGVPVQKLGLLLCLTLGIMGILTPYGTGPSPVYYGSGYLPTADYWKLGAIFGLIFLGMFLLIGFPWVLR